MSNETLAQDSTSYFNHDDAEAQSVGMTKTIIIAVCSSVAYLALGIGLIIYCSIRLMRKQQRQQKLKAGRLSIINASSTYIQPKVIALNFTMIISTA